MRVDSHPASRNRIRALVLLLASTSFIAVCVEDGVNLSPNYNTLRYRSIVIETQKDVSVEGTETMRPLNGMHGSPYPVVPTDGDLTPYFWGRSSDSDLHDGAHVSLVRIGMGTDCRVSLEGLYGGGNDPADLEQPANYNFSQLDWHMEGVNGLNTSEIMWQAALAPDAGIGCNPGDDAYQQREPFTPLTYANTVVRVAYNTLRHLRNDGKTADSSGFEAGSKLFNKLRWVEFMDDPGAHMGYSTNGDPANGQTDYSFLFQTYGTFANLVKSEWPDLDSTGRPVVAIGGISFTLTDSTELDYTSLEIKAGDAHPILKFIEYCAQEGYPLDFLSFKTRTRHPAEVAVIAQKLANFLNGTSPTTGSVRFPDAVLVLTGVDIEDATLSAQAAWVADDQRITSSYRGAFQSAVRIYLQDIVDAPVHHMIAGRAARVLKDLQPHTDDSLEKLYGDELLTRSDYFAYLHGEVNPDFDFYDEDGKLLDTIVPLPTFMNLFPFRQVKGHQRVTVSSGPDSEGMAVVATHDSASTDTLHVIIANANVASGGAQIVYEIELTDFLPQSVEHVEYKFATLDHHSVGIGSFHFSETGIASTKEGTGHVRFVHEMAIPSVHYIQFAKPVCDKLENPCKSGYECWTASAAVSSGYCVPVVEPLP